MKKIKFLSLMLIVGIAISITNVSAAIKADEYKELLGRGIAVGWFKAEEPRFTRTMIRDMKQRGFDNLRIRTATNLHSSSAELDVLAQCIDICIDEGIIPIISWVNHAVEEHSTNQDKLDYFKFWGDVARKVKHHELVGFNLFTELSDYSIIRTDLSVYEEWSQGAIDAIRAEIPNAMIILNAPAKKSESLFDIPSSLYEGDEYMMAEWHLYAAGPTNFAGQRQWVGCGSESDKANVDLIFQFSDSWTSISDIPTYLGAWMPWDNTDGTLSQSEVLCFNEYFLTQMSNHGVPWTSNAIQHYYDESNEVWRTSHNIDGANLEMDEIVDQLVSIGDFTNPTHAKDLEVYTFGNGTVSPSNGTFNFNQTVNLTASPASGWVFAGWGNDASGTNSSKSITMDAHKTIYATFKVDGGHVVENVLEPTDDAYTRSNVANGNYGSVNKLMVNSRSKKAFVKFDLSNISPVYSARLEITANEPVIVQVRKVTDDNWNEGSVNWNNQPDGGELINTYVFPAAGTQSMDVSLFVAEQAAGDGVVSFALYSSQAGNTELGSKEGNNGPKLIISTESDTPPVSYSLTTDVTGSGTVDPYSGNFNDGEPVSLTAIPEAGYEFSHWSGDASGTTNPKTITMSSNKHVIANFIEEQSTTTYELTILVNGNGSVEPESGLTFNNGVFVDLIATADPGYVFDGWSGDASGTNATTTITMDSDKTVIATFVEGPIGPEITTVTASGDAYVRGGSYSGNNYGSASELVVKQSSNASAKRFSYLQFDLSNIGTVSSAQFEVKSIGNVSADIKVYSTSDGWDEGSINWSSKPALGNLEATFEIGANGNYSVDVTPYIAAEANGDNTASFALKCATSRLMTLSSKEGSYAPRLVIEHDGSPSAAIKAVGNIEMYPNPTTGIVNISINSNDFTYGIVKVVNSFGAVVEEKSISNQEVVVDLQDYKSGLYFVIVSYNNSTVTKPVIKK